MGLFSFGVIMVIMSILMPRKIAMEFTKDLRKYSLDDKLKVKISKIRFVIIGLFFIIYSQVFTYTRDSNIYLFLIAIFIFNFLPNILVFWKL
ncbi:MAG: hypothetical protein ACRCYC_09055 [Paraclostridium sp.]|uniref:hypothetical protein n=1 Tax=Paraclostridium sp. TaxID=2023273 RepID=UPI003F311D59